ncbi:hypothetical protein [Planomicrobium okeanokoites]|uniref:Uncharacterized protein n=1 Tax=Planomicrobium okeanokoites TaxID=244 RepID=A0ABV7KSW7_PLAOK|nr:hypothetical protein [Planomicrobium okeanokoites]TAA70318.1 hypothetical protein D2910_07705 [Planomicrobium okeanokoites]
MKNKTMRLGWILPNVLMYFLLIGLLVFISLNAEGLQEINQFIIYIMLALMLGLVTVGGSFRIRSWIKEGKL